MNTVLSTAHSTAFHIKDNPYQILSHSATIKLPTYRADPALFTVSAYKTDYTCHAQQQLHWLRSILYSNRMLYYKKAGVLTAILQSSTEHTQQCFVHAVHALMKTAEQQSKRQLFSNKVFGWNKGHSVTTNNSQPRTSLREQLHCIHPQHTCTSTCTTRPATPFQLPSTTLLCTQLTNTKHSWENGTRCRDGVNVLWCRSHLVWLVFKGSIPTCTCFHLENFFVTCVYGYAYVRTAYNQHVWIVEVQISDFHLYLEKY